MVASFDSVADLYDSQFTVTPIGRSQRNQVWKYIEMTLPKNRGSALELNCGTGEDAVFLAKHGYSVIATDVSNAMLIETEKKIALHQLQKKIQTQILDLNELDSINTSQKYDLIFSNFGGLNCISPETLQISLAHLSNCLIPHGRIVLVLMQRYCLWELFYFSIIGNFKNACRRTNRKGITAHIGGNPVTTWYYSPKDLIQLAPKGLTVHSLRAIGFAVPPSYLNRFFSKRPWFLKALVKLDCRLGSWSFAYNLSDHILIDMRARP